MTAIEMDAMFQTLFHWGYEEFYGAPNAVTSRFRSM